MKASRILISFAFVFVMVASGSAQEKLKETPTIVLISGEYEYESARTLPAFQRWLEARYPVRGVYLERTKGEHIPNLDALDKADLLVMVIRRMTLPPEQLERFKKFVASGRPLIALRTSSHAFENWKEFDRDVLGGNYHNHYGNALVSPAKIHPPARDHRILKGIPAEFITGGSLYKTSPLGANATPLMFGSVTGYDPEPMAWTNSRGNQRIFYTSLGHPKDFETGPLKELIVNAIYWALDRDVPVPKGGAPPYEIAPPKTPEAKSPDVPRSSTARSNGLTPAEAVARMKLADGLTANVFAAEPDIVQPVAMNWDDRGRMWVVEYRQYPHPEGLKAVALDQYFRTKYDRVPEPPPRGARGADRIKILEDTDGDGRADKVMTFVDGLNLASGVAVGYGGVFVAQTPYLLFYPDRDGDDRPDGPPEVLLSGFGMEDTHAVVNSLTFGPDGWLYGAQGSTVTAHIRGATFQQAIWRYHPRTKKFELFAEGGGNTWSFDWDADGQLFCGTNWGGNVALHIAQGGYYVKNFSKHGELNNPYAFGYFGHCPQEGKVGGHVEIGGLIYQADALPERFRGKLISANLLSNEIKWFDLLPQGSSFRTRTAGDLLIANDPWFRPVDLSVGPDGALYIADWYDKRASHTDTNLDTWDKTNGRIYRISSEGSRFAGSRLPSGTRDLSKLSSADLVGMLAHPNEWVHREARRILAERQDRAVVKQLRKEIFTTRESHLALEYLWALYGSGGFDESFARELLARNHVAQTSGLRDGQTGTSAPLSSPALQVWTIRYLGDAGEVSGTTLDKLIAVARDDKNPHVRNQLASSARRLSAAQARPILAELMHRTEDADDPQIPLLIWWSIEHHIEDRDEWVRVFSAPETWKSAVAKQHLYGRFARRLAASGTKRDFDACATVLASAPSAADADLVAQGIEQGLVGKQIEKPPTALLAALTKVGCDDPNRAITRLAALLGDNAARRQIAAVAQNRKADTAKRVAAVGVLSQIGDPDTERTLLALLAPEEPEPLRLEVLTRLGRFSNEEIVDVVLAHWPTMSAKLRERTVDLLASRKEWARKLVETLGAEFRQQPVGVVRKIQQHNDIALNELVEKHWGRLQTATAAEKAEKARQVYHVIGPINPRPGHDLTRGREIFQARCANCHTLFGEGKKIGPDLTALDRSNTEQLIANIIDPSASIRKEFGGSVVRLRDGQILSGFITDPTPESFSVVDASGQSVVVARAQVAETAESATSVMPEGLLDGLGNADLINFFAYLQGKGRP